MTYQRIIWSINPFYLSGGGFEGSTLDGGEVLHGAGGLSDASVITAERETIGAGLTSVRIVSGAFTTIFHLTILINC
jgi:hypothetical protein